MKKSGFVVTSFCVALFSSAAFAAPPCYIASFSESTIQRYDEQGNEIGKAVPVPDIGEKGTRCEYLKKNLLRFTVPGSSDTWIVRGVDVTYATAHLSPTPHNPTPPGSSMRGLGNSR